MQGTKSEQVAGHGPRPRRGSGEGGASAAPSSPRPDDRGTNAQGAEGRAVLRAFPSSRYRSLQADWLETSSASPSMLVVPFSTLTV